MKNDAVKRNKIKRAIILVLSITLLTACLSGCNGSGDKSGAHVDAPLPPYFDAKEGTKLTDEEIKSVIPAISCDRYEIYPGVSMKLISAALFRDGEETAVDLKDPRLVRLVNLFLNTAYYSQISYTQGLLNEDYIKAVETESFRLVLKCEYGKDGIYDGCYDTITITNGQFVMYDHTAQNYNGGDLPFAMGYSPLHAKYNWLDLFGF